MTLGNSSIHHVAYLCLNKLLYYCYLNSYDNNIVIFLINLQSNRFPCSFSIYLLFCLSLSPPPFYLCLCPQPYSNHKNVNTVMFGQGGLRKKKPFISFPNIINTNLEFPCPRPWCKHGHIQSQSLKWLLS